MRRTIDVRLLQAVLLYGWMLAGLSNATPTSAPTCASGCECADTELYEHVGQRFVRRIGNEENCVHRNLRDVPATLPDKTVTLYMDLNALTLRSASFQHLTSLRKLYMSYCGLRSLPPGVFRPLRHHLVYLHLNHNYLDVLSPCLFSGFKELHFLELKGNNIEQLPMGIFHLPKAYHIHIHNNPVSEHRRPSMCEFQRAPPNVYSDGVSGAARRYAGLGCKSFTLPNFCPAYDENMSGSRGGATNRYRLADCPAGWHKVHGVGVVKCLKFSGTETKSFSGAARSCNAMGAHLVHINDSTFNEAVYQLTGRVHSWIGLTDRAQEGVFRWVHNNEICPSNSQLFHSGNPDNHALGEHCVHLRQSDGKWNDNVCSTSFPFTCQLSFDCPLRKSNFHLHRTPQPFSNATNTCQAHGVSLPTLDSRDCLRTWMTNMGMNSGAWLSNAPPDRRYAYLQAPEGLVEGPKTSARNAVCERRFSISAPLFVLRSQISLTSATQRTFNDAKTHCSGHLPGTGHVHLTASQLNAISRYVMDFFNINSVDIWMLGANSTPRVFASRKGATVYSVKNPAFAGDLAYAACVHSDA